MIYLFLLPLIAAVKVAVQGILTRKKCVTAADCFFLNALTFTAVVLVLIPLRLREIPSAKILFPALLIGIFQVLFQYGYLMAFRTGPVGLTTVLAQFALTLPILYGVLVLHESVGWLRLSGMLLMAVPFILLPKQKGGKPNLKWLFFAVGALLASGLSNVVFTVISKGSFSSYDAQITVVAGFGVAAIINWALTLLTPKPQPLFKPTPLTLCGILLCGLTLGLYQSLTVFGLAEIPTTVFYPVVNGLTVIWILFSDRILYKQHLTRTQWIGVGVGIVAIVLVNIQ